MLRNVLLVALGGAFGSALRFVVQESLQKSIQDFTPHGTFTVNMIGCFLSGFFFGWLEQENIFQIQLIFCLYQAFVVDSPPFLHSLCKVKKPCLIIDQFRP